MTDHEKFVMRLRAPLVEHEVRQHTKGKHGKFGDSDLLSSKTGLQERLNRKYAELFGEDEE